MVEGLGEKLAVIGELTVDEPRGQGRPVSLEHDLVLPHSHLELVGPGVLRDPRELLQGPSRDVRLKRAGEGLLELGLLHAQAVGVGGDHAEVLARRRDQYPGEHRPRLVTRGGPRDRGDRLDERRGGDGDHGGGLRRRQCREVL